MRARPPKSPHRPPAPSIESRSQRNRVKVGGGVQHWTVLAKRRGDGAQFAEADVGCVVLRDRPGDEGEQIDQAHVVADPAFDDTATICRSDELRCRNRRLASDAFHPVEFGFDRGQRVVSRPVHSLRTSHRSVGLTRKVPSQKSSTVSPSRSPVDSAQVRRGRSVRSRLRPCRSSWISSDDDAADAGAPSG